MNTGSRALGFLASRRVLQAGSSDTGVESSIVVEIETRPFTGDIKRRASVTGGVGELESRHVTGDTKRRARVTAGVGELESRHVTGETKRRARLTAGVIEKQLGA